MMGDIGRPEKIIEVPQPEDVPTEVPVEEPTTVPERKPEEVPA